MGVIHIPAGWANSHTSGHLTFVTENPFSRLPPASQQAQLSRTTLARKLGDGAEHLAFRPWKTRKTREWIRSA